MKSALVLASTLFLFQTTWAQQLQSSSSKTYGIILSGGAVNESNHYRYYETTTKMHKAFMDNGVDRKDIYTFFASGNSKTNDTRKIGVLDKDFTRGKKDLTFNAASSFKKNENIDINGPANVEDLKKAFLNIAAKAKPGDVVSLYVTDHGSSKGNVVMWGHEPKPEAEKTAEDLAIEKQHGVTTMRSKTMSVDQLKEMIKLLPPGVTVQIANNICYGGKLVELTDPDLNTCVVSQVDATRPSRSKLDTSPFAVAYASGLGKKSFYESYQDARAVDIFPENVGAMNSLDYFVGKELKKAKSAKPICTSVNPAGSADAAKSVAEPLAAEAEVLAVKAQIEKTQKNLKSLKFKQADFLDNEYRRTRNEMSSVHQKLFNMKEGPEKDLAYGAFNKKADALDETKKIYETKIKNLNEYILNYQKQITFLQSASPEQLEKYRKLKACMERSI